MGIGLIYLCKNSSYFCRVCGWWPCIYIKVFKNDDGESWKSTIADVWVSTRFFLSFLFNDIFNLTWCYEKAWPFCQRKKIWNDNDVLGPKRKLLAMTSIYWFDNFLNILNNYYQRFRVENLWFIMLLPATLLLERDWKRQRLNLISLNIVYIS